MPLEPRPLDLERLLSERPQLTALARRLLADEHGAEDVVQEAWVAALERPPRDERALSAWLREVVRTRALRRKRGAQRQLAREESVARPEADSVAERLRTQREVVDAVLALDEPLRDAVHARYFEGLPPREIARREGISIDTLNDRLKRARRKLRADLGRRLERGEGGVWSLALLPHAALAPGAVAVLSATKSSSVLLGELVLMKKTLAAALALLLVAAVGIWSPWREAARPPAAADGGEPALELPMQTAKATPEPVSSAAAPAATAPAVMREPALASAAVDWIVRGRVFLGGRIPAPGTEVRARLWAGYETDGPAQLDELLTSDEQGRFAWTLAAPEGSVSVRCTPVVEDATVFSDGAVVALGEPAPDGLELSIYPLDVSIVGTVRDERGRPIAEADVRGSTEDRTDAEGRYRVRGSSYRGQEYVSAKGPGLAHKRASVDTPAPGGEVVCDFSLRPAFSISGRVLEEHGLPVAGARLSTFFGGRVDATTDADGAFLLGHLDPGHETHTLSVRAEGFPTITEAVDTGSGAPVELELRLARGARVAGRVVDPQGRGVAAARICLGFSTNAWNAEWARSQDDGSFLFAGAARGEQTLWIEREGFAALKYVFLVPESGDLLDELTIELDPGRALSGRVLDGQGAGVPDVLVTPRYEGDLLDNRTKTDGAGAFELRHVPNVPLELSFYRAAWDRVQVQVERGDIDGLQAVMNPSGRVAGRVVDAATGTPIESFRVRLERVAEPGAPRISLAATWTREGRAFSGPEGTWETSDLELPTGGVVGVEVRAEGYATSELVRAVIEADPDPDAFVIALSRGQLVTGRVIDAGNGAPVAGARVSYRPLGTGPRSVIRAASRGDAWAGYFTRSDAAGEFLFEHVAPGRVVFEAEHEEYQVDGSSSSLEINPDGPAPKIVIELGGAGGIRGVLLDAEGSPRAGVELSLFDVEVPSIAEEFRRAATTDPEGRFAFADLPDGFYRLGEAEPSLQEHRPGIARGLCVFLRDKPQLELVLKPAGTASIQASLNAEGVLPEQVELTLMRLPDGSSAAPTTTEFYTLVAEEGGFELSGLAAGRYKVESRWFDGARLVRGEDFELELADGQVARPSLPLSPR